MGIKFNFKKIIISISLLFLLNITVINNNVDLSAKQYEVELTNPNVPVSYYNGLDLNDSTQEFNNELSNIINRGFKGHSYSYNNTVLKDTDPNPKNPSQIICFYTGQSLSGGWNKEHVWAKSHGFPNSGAQPYSDAHHLRPTLNSINSSRSNSDFGEVTGGKSDNFGNKWTNDTFEPRDEVKGDVARIMFYMAIMYKDSPYNLLLVNDPHTKTSTGNGRFGNLQTLLKWHYNDPVSKEEYYRNNIIYRDYQKNRNPFIDHPEFVDISFPNNFKPVEPDYTKINEVIRLIYTLPQNIVLEDKNLVTSIKNQYDKLNYNEQKLITNYNILEEAIKKIKELEGNGEEEENPDITIKENITIDFTKASGLSTGYKDNVEFTVDNKNYFASSAYKSGSEFRLGSNKSKKLLSKYNPAQTTSDGSTLELLYNIEDAIKFEVSNSGIYGTVSQWELLYSSNNGVSFTALKIGDFDEKNKLEINLDKAYSGRFAFNIIGSTARLKLTEMKISVGTSTKVEDEFLGSDSLANLNIEYKNDLEKINSYKIEKVILNMGVKFSVNAFDKNAKYGILYVDSTNLLKYDFVGEYISGSLDDFLNDEKIQNFNIVKNDLTNDLIKENQQYLMRCSIDVSDDFNREIYAVGYMELNGHVYFLEEIQYSAHTLAQKYIELSIVQSEYLINILSML